MDDALTNRVREEIEDLHRFFVGWFTGQLAVDTFESGFSARFDAPCPFIPPAGTLLDIDDLATAVRDAHGSNPDFRIQIRAVKVQHTFDGHVLATYEEWQRNALVSTPPDNARRATVLFREAERLKWRHIHETWLPADAQAAGPWDF